MCKQEKAHRGNWWSPGVRCSAKLGDGSDAKICEEKREEGGRQGGRAARGTTKERASRLLLLGAV